MRDEWDQKYLPVERVIELLRQLPAGSWVYPNSVGNLRFTSPNFEDELGFVDFLLAGEVNFYST
jgi:hypothetical protein